LEIAISGGKHSVSGAASSEGGLVIDLSKMRDVKVDTEKNLIIAQGGCLWEDVDKAGAEYDLVTGIHPLCEGGVDCSWRNGQ
jgi:FAD/FMN-containing dehydrogenase